MDKETNEVVSSKWPIKRKHVPSKVLFMKDGVKDFVKNFVLDTDYCAPLATVEGSMRDATCAHMEDGIGRFEVEEARLKNLLDTPNPTPKQVDSKRQKVDNTLDTSTQFVTIMLQSTNQKAVAKALLSQGHDTVAAVFLRPVSSPFAALH